jgi:tetratricopeptide (TPR) repeat protein
MTTYKPRYLKLERQGPREWAFNRPDQWEFFDKKMELAQDAERDGDEEGAIRIYLELIETCPEYLPALNNLGLLYQRQERLEKAIPLLEAAVGLGLACIPDEFEEGIDLIPWHWEDNRAFLRAYENLGSCHIGQALDYFEHLLELNPGYRGIGDLVAQLRGLYGIEDEPAEGR